MVSTLRHLFHIFRTWSNQNLRYFDTNIVRMCQRKAMLFVGVTKVHSDVHKDFYSLKLLSMLIFSMSFRNITPPWIASVINLAPNNESSQALKNQFREVTPGGLINALQKFNLNKENEVSCWVIAHFEHIYHIMSPLFPWLLSKKKLTKIVSICFL